MRGRVAGVVADDFLRHGVLYQAPSGRLCTLDPADRGHPDAPYCTMLYVRADGTPATRSHADGFCMSRINWYLLRRVG
jgi:hypothetical protein